LDGRARASLGHSAFFALDKPSELHVLLTTTNPTSVLIIFPYQCTLASSKRPHRRKEPWGQRKCVLQSLASLCSTPPCIIQRSEQTCRSSSSSHTRKAHCNCLNLFPQPTSTYQISSIDLHRATLPPPFTALSMWLDGMSRCLIHKRGCVGDHQHTTPKDLRQKEKKHHQECQNLHVAGTCLEFQHRQKRGATQTLDIFLVP